MCIVVCDCADAHARVSVYLCIYKRVRLGICAGGCARVCECLTE